MTDYASLRETALEAVAAGEGVLRELVGRVETSWKKLNDPVTEADFAVEKVIRALLAEKTPQIGFLGEEEGGADPAAGGLVWVLDPVDGTSNFARAVPLYAISLGLYEDGQPVVGVISHCAAGETFSAARGQGATLNDRRLAVSDCSALERAMVSFGDRGSEYKLVNGQALLDELFARCYRVRTLGSSALSLANTAAGRFDVSADLSNKSWDVSAGVIIVREAGGEVFDIDGSEHTLASRLTLAAPSALREPLSALVAGLYVPPPE